jgi:hypothetical protein
VLGDQNAFKENNQRLRFIVIDKWRSVKDFEEMFTVRAVMDLTGSQIFVEARMR